jgi:hypothetical protein
VVNYKKMKLCVGVAALAVLSCIAVAVLLFWRPSERFNVGTKTPNKIAGVVAVKVNIKGKPKNHFMTLNKRLSLPENVTSFTVQPNEKHVALIFDKNGKQTSFAEKTTTYPSSFEGLADIQYYRAVEFRKI